MKKKPEVYDRFMKYEFAIINKFKNGLPPEMPSELKVIFSENPNAYSFYRNQLFYELRRWNGENKLLDDFHLLIRETKDSHPKEFGFLIDHLSNRKIIEQYDSSWFNVFEIWNDIKNSDKITQQSCFLYQSIYESDTLYIVLATISELRKNGKLNLELNNLKDKKGNLLKGAIINFISSRISDFHHLKTAFSKSYNAGLRNTIGHNNYQRTETGIRSFDGKIIVTKEDFFKSIYYFQELNNGLINALSSENLIDSHSDFKKCGILGIAFSKSEGNAVLVLFQLWCFYDMEENQPWLKHIKFKISPDSVETSFGAKFDQKGKKNRTLELWFQKLVDQDASKIEIVTIPVTPIFTEGEEVLDLLTGKFKQLNKEKSKVVDYNIEKR